MINFTQTIMNILEQQIYLQFTKSGVRSFENLIDSLLKHDDVVSDAELVNQMQRISKKLQTVINKWDSKLPKRAPFKTAISDFLSEVPPVQNPGFSSCSCSIDDSIVGFKNRRRASTPSFTEIDPKPGCSSNLSTTTSYDDEKNIMLALKDINESLIIGAFGFYVEEVTTGFWRCNPCDANNLPLNNLVSHVNGKNHKKKINFKGV